MPCSFLGLPDEALAVILLKCCDMTASLERSPTHSTQTLYGPSCLLLCTSKRLRDCCKKDLAQELAAKRDAFFEALFWSRVRFLRRSWNSIQRAAIDGLSAAATQKHVLQKGGQSMEIEAHFIRRKRNKCHLYFDFRMRDVVVTGLSAVSSTEALDLPKAYATRPEKRNKKQQAQMRDWTRDRSVSFDQEFGELHKHFAHHGRPMFAYV